jgi:hypothetical protein
VPTIVLAAIVFVVFGGAFRVPIIVLPVGLLLAFDLRRATRWAERFLRESFDTAVDPATGFSVFHALAAAYAIVGALAVPAQIFLQAATDLAVVGTVLAGMTLAPARAVLAARLLSRVKQLRTEEPDLKPTGSVAGWRAHWPLYAGLIYMALVAMIGFEITTSILLMLVLCLALVYRNRPDESD